MKTWLKYGLIADALYILFVIIGLIDGIFIQSPLNLGNLLENSTMLCFSELTCVGEGCGVCMFESPIIYLVLLFIIGSIIGKIKSKKQQPVQTQPQVQTK